MIYISQLFNLGVRGHRDVDFVDIPVDTDVELFIDPTLIEVGTSEIALICRATLQSFFQRVAECCASNNIADLRKLLQHGTEPNETHLGMSVARSCGKGTKKEKLMSVFTGLIDNHLFQAGVATKLFHVCMFAKNFDRDRLSDLLTNVLRDPLSKFTIDQCQKHKIPLAGLKTGYYWDIDCNDWVHGKWLTPLSSGDPLMLVPKRFVAQSYHYGVNAYLQHYVLPYWQQYHLDRNTEQCIRRTLKSGHVKISAPPRKTLRKLVLPRKNHKGYIVQFALEHPYTVIDFDKERNRKYESQFFFMADYELDKVVYGKKRTIA